MTAYPRGRLALALLAAALATAAPVRADETAFKIGVLSDMSGFNADLAGPGTVAAAHMAVEDYGGRVLGRPIEILEGDHLNKPDVGLGIAREWYDSGVGAIFDVGLSSIALGVQTLAREKNKIVVFGSSLTADLTGPACSPNGIAWTTDNYAQAKAITGEALSEGYKDWYFIAADYVLGRSYVRDASGFIEKAGGKILGTVMHPLNMTDASSPLVAASSSGASAIALATTTANAASILKQSVEFNVGQGKQRLFAFNLQERDIDGIGLAVTQGMLTTAPFYWDLNDATRAFTARFVARMHVIPNAVQAGTYGAVLHYLKAVAAVGSDASGPVLARMRATPIHDFMTEDGHIREDGRVIREMYVFRVKAPAQSKSRWDLYSLVAKIPGEAAFRPLAEGGCPLTAAK